MKFIHLDWYKIPPQPEANEDRYVSVKLLGRAVPPTNGARRTILDRGPSSLDTRLVPHTFRRFGIVIF